MKWSCERMDEALEEVVIGRPRASGEVERANGLVRVGSSGQWAGDT